MKTKQDTIFSSKTLSYFLQLAETMSYTQAAQILGITQPALTQQIKKLERTVGAPLFYSVGKKLHLSDAGYTMLDATHQIYETLNMVWCIMNFHRFFSDITTFQHRNFGFHRKQRFCKFHYGLL